MSERNNYAAICVSDDSIRNNILKSSSCSNQRIILVISPCRSGSTALGMVLANTQYPYYHQPIKTIYRNKLFGQEYYWVISRKMPIVLVKETFGPFFAQESMLDPVGILLDCGYTPMDIQVIAMMREPLSCLASWQKLWPNMNVDNFIAAHVNTAQRREEAIARGVPVTTYIHEAINDYSSRLVIQRLCNRVGLPYQPDMVTWEDGPRYIVNPSNVVLPIEPDIFITPHVHQRLFESKKYSFLPSDSYLISDSTQSAIERAHLFALYEKFRSLCMQDLRMETPYV